MEIRNLVIDYEAGSNRVRAIDGIDLAVEDGETVGIVGESGSGKSTLGLAIGRLLPPNARMVNGEVVIQGRSLFELADSEIRDLRRRYIGYVFQNPMASLDPTIRVGRQLALLNDGGRTSQVVALLEKVGLSDAHRVARSYPHELSGGMAQRVAIARAIARNPRVVIADEPTASLDATIRTQILELLISLPVLVGASVILLSHDIRAIAKYCRRVAVMYGGRIIEAGTSSLVFGRPSHPYTRGLLKAAPGDEIPGGWIYPIPGIPPLLHHRSESCAFASRCGWAIQVCGTTRPEIRRVEDRLVVCHRAEEVVESGAST